jgi:hypothetical protein
MYTHSSAIQFIEQKFPSLKEELHDEVIDGLLHPQIGEFSRFAQGCIDTGNEAGWKQVTVAFMELWLNCDDAVKNALNVSFLEHLNFNDRKRPRQWAFNSMPAVMRQAWQEMDSYNRRMHGG